MPLQLSLLGRFPVGKKLTPYVLAGAVISSTVSAWTARSMNSWNAVGFTLTEKVDNAFGFHFGAGLEYVFGKALSVGFGCALLPGQSQRRAGASPTMQSAVEATGTFSGLNLNALVFCGRSEIFL